MRDHLATLRKAFDKEIKEKEAATQKAVGSCSLIVVLGPILNDAHRLSRVSSSTLKSIPTSKSTCLFWTWMGTQK